jgi:hypothetical protein
VRLKSVSAVSNGAFGAHGASRPQQVFIAVPID